MEKEANGNLQMLVERLKKEGFPSIVEHGQAIEALSSHEVDLLDQINEVWKKEREIRKKKGDQAQPLKDDAWWTLRSQLRNLLSQALLADRLIVIDLIQLWSVEYGAIPDPATGWKYTRDLRGEYVCLECGSTIMVTHLVPQLISSLESAPESDLVISPGMPWCPTCDSEPTDEEVLSFAKQLSGSN